jgi:hypothetical protein
MPYTRLTERGLDVNHPIYSDLRRRDRPKAAGRLPWENAALLAKSGRARSPKHMTVVIP